MSEGYLHVPAHPSIRGPLPPEQAGAEGTGCCPAIREVLSLVGDKWSVLTVFMLSKAPLRFNALRRQVEGISQRMLTRTLRELERNGLVTRTVEATTPPSVEYALTPLGHTLLEPVSALVAWTKDHYPQMRAAQARFG